MKIFLILIFLFIVVCCKNPKVQETNIIPKDTTQNKIDRYKVTGIDPRENFKRIAETDTTEVGEFILYSYPTDSIEIRPILEFDSMEHVLMKEIFNSYELAKEVESLNHKKYSSIFKRVSDTLIIQLTNGEQFVLIDKSELEFGDGCKHYTFSNYFVDKELILIFVQNWEGGEYILLDRKSGNSIKLIGIPYFNLNGNGFIATCSDLYTGYNFNGLQYCSYENNSFKEVFRLPIYNYGPDLLKWMNENEVIIRKKEDSQKYSYTKIKIIKK